MMTFHIIQPPPPPGQEVCDFCSERPVRWRYPARAHTTELSLGVGSVTAGSPDDWAACQTCHDIIRRSDRDALTQRSAEVLGQHINVPAPILVPELRKIHDNFWAAREGAPEPHEVT